MTASLYIIGGFWTRTKTKLQLQTDQDLTALIRLQCLNILNNKLSCHDANNTINNIGLLFIRNLGADRRALSPDLPRNNHHSNNKIFGHDANLH